MNEPGERALVQILAAHVPLVALTADRITWDDEELDTPSKSITLRTLSTRLPAAGISGRGGVRQCLVEMSAHDDTSGGAAILADLVVEAMDPHDGQQLDVDLVGGGTVRFGGIQLTDFQQAPSSQERRYRKSATFSVWFYE